MSLRVTIGRIGQPGSIAGGQPQPGGNLNCQRHQRCHQQLHFGQGRIGTFDALHLVGDRDGRDGDEGCEKNHAAKTRRVTSPSGHEKCVRSRHRSGSAMAGKPSV